MSAILSRVYLGEGDVVVTEYLMRDNALLVEHEWVWQPDRECAWIFDFKSHDAERAEIERQTQAVNGQPVRPWAVNISREEWMERMKGRDDRRAAITLESVNDLSPAAEPPTSTLNGPRKEPTAGDDAPSKGVSPAAMATGTITERARAARRNRKVATERKRTADDWKAVLERMEGKRRHEDVFAETERRCGG